jgi:hypothetical protein
MVLRLWYPTYGALRNIIRAAITAAEYLFELLRFGQLLQILVDGGFAGGVEAHVTWG